jgi:hypothetical protein
MTTPPEQPSEVERDILTNRAIFDPIEALFGREPTVDEIQRANEAVMLNLNDDSTPKWGTAQGYACALTAIMQRAATPAPVQDDDGDSGMSGDAVAMAEAVWAQLPVGNHSWAGLATYEKALVCHTLARLRLSTDTALVEALRSAPIPGLKEPMRAFRKRSDEWLNTTYRKALASRGGDNGK